MADIIYLYFGHPRPSKGSSHSRLVNGVFVHICRARSVDGRALVPSLEDLQHRIVQHKTDVPEHLADPRLVPGLSWGADERAAIAMGLIAPEGETRFDTRTTEDPVVLLREIEGYIVAVTEFLEASAAKSVASSEQHNVSDQEA